MKRWNSATWWPELTSPWGGTPSLPSPAPGLLSWPSGMLQVGEPPSPLFLRQDQGGGHPVLGWELPCVRAHGNPDFRAPALGNSYTSSAWNILTIRGSWSTEEPPARLFALLSAPDGGCDRGTGSFIYWLKCLQSPACTTRLNIQLKACKEDSELLGDEQAVQSSSRRGGLRASRVPPPLK